MISIDKPLLTPVALVEQQEAVEELLLQRRERFKWATEHYSVPIKEDLKVLYHTKCAFCEQRLTENNTPQKFTVEHYRPKSIYWWLGNEWTNLFPTCEKCNGNKEDLFPLRYGIRNRASAPLNAAGSIERISCAANCQELLQEQPKILHPEVDKPERFFAFLTDGRVVPMENLTNWERDRAEYMILKFLGIPSLVEKRLTYINNLQDDFNREVTNFLAIMENEEPTDRELKLGFYSFLEKLFVSNAPSQEFSKLGHFMSNNFDTFFIDTLPEDYPTNTLKEILRQARILFLQEKTNNTP